MSDDLFGRLDGFGKRLDDVEQNLYGDPRTAQPGLVQEVRNLTIQVSRLVLVVWGLVAVSLIVLMTVAMAVLL